MFRRCARHRDVVLDKHFVISEASTWVRVFGRYWVHSKDRLSKHRGQRARERSASYILYMCTLTVLFVDPFCEAAWGMSWRRNAALWPWLSLACKNVEMVIPSASTRTIKLIKQVIKGNGVLCKWEVAQKTEVVNAHTMQCAVGIRKTSRIPWDLLAFSSFS